ncbi:MAG: hypothetical protein JW867_05135 [Candidatus Omnitrophica bacterium]|nr:hypothetical protein [Candidatus Omnitrophota bacterium]
MNNIKKARLDQSRVVCVEGFFDKTLTPNLKENKNLKIASLVHIDCDLYESAVPALRFITDLVETGTIIMFDDWNSFEADPERGVRKACSEWLISNPHITLEDWHWYGAYGKSFMVKAEK